MSSEINIQPYTASKIATKVEVTIEAFSLFAKSGKASVTFKDDNGLPIGRREQVAIPEDVYASWSTDDSVIADYVLKQLGLTKA